MYSGVRCCWAANVWKKGRFISQQLIDIINYWRTPSQRGASRNSIDTAASLCTGNDRRDITRSRCNWFPAEVQDTHEYINQVYSYAGRESLTDLVLTVKTTGQFNPVWSELLSQFHANKSIIICRYLIYIILCSKLLFCNEKCIYSMNFWSNCKEII